MRGRGRESDMVEGFSSVEKRRRAIFISLPIYHMFYTDGDLFPCRARAVELEHVCSQDVVDPRGRSWSKKPTVPQNGVRGSRRNLSQRLHKSVA